VWISGLAERFDVGVSPYAAGVFDELSDLIYDGLAFSAVGERAPLPERAPPETQPSEPQPREPRPKGLRLVAYRPLFAGPAVERVPELQFQRAQPVLEIAEDDARARGITPGSDVVVRSNGTSATLRARISRTLPKGTVRAAQEHVADLPHDVEVTRA
jgi:anaerobic selenocysteine-containing dehydrogenase